MEAVFAGVFNDMAIDAVADEASRMQRLAVDLALLSQAEEGSLPMVLELADLREGASAAERLRLQFDHQRVALEVERGVALPVSVDPLCIGQVFTNLLGNALIHTPAGGVVALRSIRESDMAVVEVVDSGSGIRRDELDHIFERFYRLPNSTRPAGRGIGLTIARSIARAHGGDVTADSMGPGQGSTFRISIPLHEPDRG